MTRRDPIASSLKRITDLVVAVTVLVMFWPLIACAAILLIFSVGHPVLFRQIRPGLYGRPFTMVKLRTMTYGLDRHGNLLPDEDRLTRIGALVRLFHIDELPQLWAVIKGDLSVVGPRPLLMEYMQLYTPEQRRRHQVKPGLTGWVAVNGGNTLNWEDKFRLDLWYVDNWSFLLDLQILIRTCLSVIRREGANPTGHTTVEPFRGSESRKNDRQELTLVQTQGS